MINFAGIKIEPQTQNIKLASHAEKTLPGSDDKKHNRTASVNTVVPSILIAGGGLLIYLGLKRPNVDTVMNQIVRKHKADMEHNVSKFFEQANDTLNGFLENSLQKIYKYKNEHMPQTIPEIDNLTQNITTTQELIEKVDKAFDFVDSKLNPTTKPGSSEFDSFSVGLKSDIRKIETKLATEKLKIQKVLEDLTQIDSTPEYIKKVGKEKYNEALEKAQKSLNEAVSEHISKMNKYTNKKIYQSVNLQSKIMANIITERRNLICEMRKNIITASFQKMRELTGLKDFMPSFNQIRNLEKFSALNKEELCPIKNIPPEIAKSLEYDVFLNFIKSYDFSKINKEDVLKLFYSIDPHKNIKDIGITIDRIRLIHASELMQKQNNEAIYKNIIAKLEYLEVKLRKYGERLFLKDARADFSSMRKEEFHSAINHMNEISSRLGCHSLTQANRDFIRKYPQFSQTQFSKNADKIRENPEDFFM